VPNLEGAVNPSGARPAEKPGRQRGVVAVELVRRFATIAILGELAPHPYYTAFCGVKPGRGPGPGRRSPKKGSVMAFHPMRTFQKNRTFWMAAILLICMVTFVLCTGMQGGDFAGWIMSIFRGSGAKATEIGGRTVYIQDLDNLRRKRD